MQKKLILCNIGSRHDFFYNCIVVLSMLEVFDHLQILIQHVATVLIEIMR